MTIDRRQLLLSSLLAPLFAGTMTRPGLAAGNLLPTIDAAAAQALKDGASPGLQLAVWHKGKPLIAKSYGFGNMDARSLVTNDSVFRIGSLTKQFIAAAIIRLAASGRLHLDDPVATALPVMASLKQVTLLELMHHTAGLHFDETAAPATRGTPKSKSQADLAAEIAAQPTPFDFEPGTAWRYSNANYIVLGAVIEAVTGKSLSQALAELIFRPLGLADTAVDAEANPAAKQVPGYTPHEPPGPAFTPVAPMRIDDAGGAGAIRSTASDLCKWHTGLLSRRLLSAADLEIMLAPGRLRDGRLSGANRALAEDASYGETQYAGGLLVSPPSDPHPSILHYGFIDGFAAVLQTALEKQVTFAVLCNADVGPATPFRAIRQAVMKELV